MARSKVISEIDCAIIWKTGADARHSEVNILDNSEDVLVCDFSKCLNKVRVAFPLAKSLSRYSDDSKIIQQKIYIWLNVATKGGIVGQTLEWIHLLSGENVKNLSFWRKLKGQRFNDGADLEWDISDLLNRAVDSEVEIYLVMQFVPFAGQIEIRRPVFSEISRKGNVSRRQDRPDPMLTTQSFITRSKIDDVVKTPPSMPKILGKIESTTSGNIRGWAVTENDPEREVSIDVIVNGEFYQKIKANRRRGDLERKNLSRKGGGFEFSLTLSPSGKADLVQLRDSATQQIIGQSVEVQDLPFRKRNYDRTNMILSLLKIRDPKISIIIPIYNAYEELKACLQSIIDFTTHQSRLILINDASPDANIRKLLEIYAEYKDVVVVNLSDNVGFSRAVNMGIEIAGEDDVVVLNSDTRVTPRWIENLMMAAHAARNIASATAMSDNAGAFSVSPPDGGWRIDWSDAELARKVSQASAGIYPVAPTNHGFCMYLRRDAICSVGNLDAEAFPRGYGEENDWSMRCTYAGLKHVVDDRTIIFHRVAASFGAQKNVLYSSGRSVIDKRYPEYKALVTQFNMSTDLATARHRARWALRTAMENNIKPRPRVMYVITTLTGGTPQTNRDLMKGVCAEYETFLLHCDRKKITLTLVTPEADVELERYDLHAEIRIMHHRSDEYDNIVSEWLLAYSIELIHLRHIAWHSFGLIDSAHDLRIPIIYSLHDFYIGCPTIKLLDADLKYCGGLCTVGDADCRPELWPRESVPRLRNAWVHNWRGMFRPLLQKCDAFVTTSDSAKNVITTIYPELKQKRFPVIPHGRDFDTDCMPFRARLKKNEPLRILVPGNISKAKGALILRELGEIDVDGRIEIHIAGQIDASLQNARVILHGPYERDQFHKIAEKINPHVGAIFSIWPETFSHTLTELWSNGLPVIAFNIGAVGERISKTGAGWLLDDMSVVSVYRALLNIGDNPSELDRQFATVDDWRKDYVGQGNIAEMASHYLNLYSDVLASRKAYRLKEKFNDAGK